MDFEPVIEYDEIKIPHNVVVEELKKLIKDIQIELHMEPRLC